MELLVFIECALIIILCMTNITHWTHVIRFKLAKTGKEYKSGFKGSTAKARITKKGKYGVWYVILCDNKVSNEDYVSFDEFFSNW